jgi:hypothetical protein
MKMKAMKSVAAAITFSAFSAFSAFSTMSMAQKYMQLLQGPERFALSVRNTQR